MVIWQATSDIEYHYLALMNENDARALSLVGKPVSANWKPLQVEIVYREGKTFSDFPVMTGGHLICNEKALAALYPVISDSTEFLPLICGGSQFYIFNVTEIRHCLIRERSEIEYFKSGDIRSIVKYSFEPDCVKDALIFKIPERIGGPIFVTDAFKHLIEANQLTGLVFRKVWGS